MKCHGCSEKVRFGNLCKCKANLSHLNGFRDKIFFLFGTSLFLSLLICTTEPYVLKRNNHNSDMFWVRKVYLTFSKISKSQLFRANLKSNFICLFLSFIASQKITLHIDTPCRNSFIIYTPTCKWRITQI